MLFVRKILSLAILVLALPAFATTPITGVVTNKTTNKPAAGDHVFLVRQADMETLLHTTADDQGHFTLYIPDEGTYLIQVIHDGVVYFGSAVVNTQSHDIAVYDSAPHVKEVTVEADVMRIQTDAVGKTLTFTENFFIKNASNPPLTQFSDQPFEFVLPEFAVIDDASALLPGSVPVKAKPLPLSEGGHYTFFFPILPDAGETRFQVTYHIPYSGKQALSPSPLLPTDIFAIVLPRTMTFQPKSPSPYGPPTKDTATSTYVTRIVEPGEALGFTLSGSGLLPPNPSLDSGKQHQSSR